MNKIILLFAIVLGLGTTHAQTPVKEYKAGHIFNISLPDYMSKTNGLNDVASIQYKSVVKDVYGFVIVDTKEELAMVEMNFSSVNEFYENFIKDFLVDQEKRTISKPRSQKKGEVNIIESDASYYDKEIGAEIFYLTGIVETKTAFYKVITWSSLENKDKFKADFQNILYSIKD